MNKLNQVLLTIVFLVGIVGGIQYVYVSSFTEREVNVKTLGTLFYVRENIWTGKKCITERIWERRVDRDIRGLLPQEVSKNLCTNPFDDDDDDDNDK